MGDLLGFFGVFFFGGGVLGGECLTGCCLVKINESEELLLYLVLFEIIPLAVAFWRNKTESVLFCLFWWAVQARAPPVTLGQNKGSDLCNATEDGMVS